jgi:hypothetical protein
MNNYGKIRRFASYETGMNERIKTLIHPDW